MKTRKILPLLALAVVALFALSSCDAMLESLFPADTGQLSTQGTNSITVEAGVWWFYLDKPGTGKLRIEIWDSTFTNRVDYRTFDVYYTGYDTIYYSADFNFLVDGTYYVEAWIDQNGDGLPNDINYGYPWDNAVTVNAGAPNGYQYVDVY